MAENSEMPPGGPANQTPEPRLMIQTQYVKDLSFENPRGPMSLKFRQGLQVEIQGLQVQRKRVAADLYEVTLDLQLQGQAEESTVLVLELVYAGVFVVLNVPESSLDFLLLTECPRLLFPAVQWVIANATHDGGFLPLLLDPIDFAGLYRRQHQQAEDEAERAGRPAPSQLVGDTEVD
jgi:preprotein translocase subunit SecB